MDAKGLNWTYYDGWVLYLAPDKTTGQVDNVMPINFRELKSSPEVPSMGKSFDDVLGGEVTDSSRLSFRQLQQEINAEREKGRDTKARGMEVDLYGKIALPIASLIFGIVGAALGLNTQRGGGKTVGFGVAIFIVFIYWVFYHAMFVVGKNGGLPPALASFLPDIIGVVVGIILAMRASR
jgi:lipopolysaccharide export system permease protein